MPSINATNFSPIFHKFNQQKVLQNSGEWGLPEMSMGSTFNVAVTGGNYSFFPFESSHYSLETQVPHYRTNIATKLSGCCHN